MRLVIDLQASQGSSHTRGIGRYSRELAMAMAREPREHEVIIALSGGMPDTAADLAAGFAAILPPEQIRLWHPPPGTGALPGSPLRGFAEALRAQFLASLRPDLVHVCSLFEGLGDDVISLQAARLERLPVVATCYDLIPLIRHQEFFGPSGMIRHAAEWYYRCLGEMSISDGLLAISEFSRNEAVQHLSYPPERVFNVGAGVSPQFRPANLSPEAREALLRRHGLQDGFILFLASGEARKNEAGLIAAYAKLPQALRGRHQLLIVGKTDQAALRVTIAGLRIPFENVVVIDFVPDDDLAKLYSTCGLFVFPSLHEGFGLPVAEAMACGAPAIASNTSSLPEVVGRADAMFDPSDPDAIASCMRRVLENRALCDELAAYGPSQAARFTWPSSATHAWDALEEIHRRRPRQSESRSVGVLLPRPRLAFISPLSAMPTGAIDNDRDLLLSLARFYDITLVSEVKPFDIRLAAVFPWLDPTGFLHQANRFDRVLYRIGNSLQHRFQIEDLLPNCPGVVVLLDAFLSDLLNRLADQRGRPDEFRAALLRSHGYQALRTETDAGRAAAVAQYPCCLPVLQNAIGVIQQSTEAVAVLREHFGASAAEGIAVIPPTRAIWPGLGELAGEERIALSDEADVATPGTPHDDAPRRAAPGEAARGDEFRQMSPEIIARRYRDAIERAYAVHGPAVVGQCLEPEAQATAALPEGRLVVARALARSFPHRWRTGGRPRFMIDMSELARRDSGSGIQRVLRELGRRVLATPPAGFRGEAVRTHAGRVRKTFAVPLRLLGLPPLNLVEQPLDAGNGDVLLCADLNAQITDEEFADLRRLQLDGMRVVLLVYDLLPILHPQLFPAPIARLVPRWYSRALAIADAAVCISRAVADEVVDWLDAHPGGRTAPLPIGWFHLGADFSAEPISEPPAPGVAAALAAAQHRPTVLMVGTIEPRKGYRQAFAAFESLWQAGEEIGLTIVGKNGWNMGEFAAGLASSAASNHRLHWLTDCGDAELRQLYHAPRGLLMASTAEGFGLPIIEAAQAGIPVLARDIPVFREIAGDAARYFVADTPDALAAAVRCWMADGFTPSSSGIRPLTWDDSYSQLCASIVNGEWHTVWRR